MKIKKQFQDLIQFLEENQSKKVSSILDDVRSMSESKKQDSTVILNRDGSVFAIFCWYHKQWEIITDVEYGSKKNTKTGLNTMCKIGVSKWTKKQSTAVKETAAMFDGLESEEIQVSDMKQLRADIEARRLTINTDDMPEGYQSEEEVMKLMK